LANFWKSITDPPAQRLDLGRAAAVWTALTAPTSCVPLVPGEGAGQEFCTLSVIDLPNDTPVLASVKVSLAPKSSRYAQPAVVGASACCVAGLDLMAEHLEDIYTDALSQARSAARRSAARAVWLGGTSAVAVGWRDRIEAVCAVMGLRAEIVEEPARRLRNVEAALGASAPPAYLLVWRPMCRGAERLVKRYERASADVDVIFLDETAFPDVVLETRLALLERGLAEPTPTPSEARDRTPPVAGEERYYIKVGGSKAGDVLVQVPDCGHGQWGGDVRRKAPRALMGVGLLEGIRPKALFRCARCSKNRWCARF
jgi:hypothetical protein